MTLDIIVLLVSFIAIIGLLTIHLLYALHKFGVFDTPDYVDAAYWGNYNDNPNTPTEKTKSHGPRPKIMEALTHKTTYFPILPREGRLGMFE